MKQERNSNFELLRIFCMVGIAWIHSLGQVKCELIGANAEICIAIMSIFNIGVTCFMLISGYYGINFNLEKMLKLHLCIVFYSIMSFIIQDDFSVINMIKAIFPIISIKYWYLSSYYFIALLSCFLNQISEKMNRKEFEKLLLILLVLFSIIPTFLYFGITNDLGKGIINMCLIYLIGRYIAKYMNNVQAKKSATLVVFFSVFVTIVLDTGVSIIAGEVKGIFSRDWSLFTIVSAVGVFMIFKAINIRSSIINFIAGNMLSIYIFEGAIRRIINHYINLETYIHKSYFILVNIAYVLLVMAICVLVNQIRVLTIGKLEKGIVKIEMKFLTYVKKLIIKIHKEIYKRLSYIIQP